MKMKDLEKTKEMDLDLKICLNFIFLFTFRKKKNRGISFRSINKNMLISQNSRKIAKNKSSNKVK